MARWSWLAVVTLAVLAAPHAYAGTAEDEIQKRDDVIADLSRRMDVLTDEVATLRTQVAVPEEPELVSAYGLGPAASKVYGVARGLSIGGYGEANYINFVGDEENSDLDRSDALRTVIYLGYKFSESIVFNSEIEFEHGTTSNVNNGAGSGSVSVELAALDFLWKPALNVRVGHLLVPMGFVNEVHEPPFFYGVQRPETEVRILPSTWHENGVGIFGNLGETVEYRLYTIAGFNAQNFTDAGVRSGRQQGNRSLTEDFAFVTRVDWTPELLPGFLLGGSVYVGDSGQDVEVAGGDVPDARLWIFEGHTQYRNGPFHARGLFAFSQLSDTRELNTVLARPNTAPIAHQMLGGYVELAYDVYPCLFGDEERQLEPFVRVEYVDTQYDVIDGIAVNTLPYQANRDRANWIHAGGVNFYPHPNVVLKVEYRNINTRGQGERADELGLGMGFAF